MLRGYARVSTADQDTALQLDAFERAGVVDVGQEKRSSVVRRPVLDALLLSLQPGDVLVVYKIDRLARSLSDLLRILDRLRSVGVAFRSLTEAIDTDTPTGRLMMQMLGAVAEFERNIILERSTAGQAAAYARGAMIGRPRVLSPSQEAEVYQALKAGVSQAHWRVNMACTIRLSRRLGCVLSARTRLESRDVFGPSICGLRAWRVWGWAMATRAPWGAGGDPQYKPQAMSVRDGGMLPSLRRLSRGLPWRPGQAPARNLGLVAPSCVVRRLGGGYAAPTPHGAAGGGR